MRSASMSRRGPRLLILLLAPFLAPVSSSFGRQAPDASSTLTYIRSLQTEEGGFAAESGQPATLGATNAAIRVLKYEGGSIPDVAACIRFVQSCFNPSNGGFAPRPNGTPDVPTTASGLMAMGELKINAPELVDAALNYLAANASDFAQVRIAVAGLEAVGKTSPAFGKWRQIVEEGRNPDGTWGQGDAQAFETGGRAVALLRMGVEIGHRDTILDAMRKGQREDGGWSSGDGPSDLSSSYRVMRGFFMMNEKPRLDAIQDFVRNCRNSDGGYGSRPGEPSSVSATYMATIVLRWTRLLDGLPAFQETAGFDPLFNGQDLTGWQGDTSLWRVRNGMLVGTSPGLDHNEFLATEARFGDFILQLSFRLQNGHGNSGIQFRSERLEGHEMKGYQADIGEDYWGCLYDESRRNRILARASESALSAHRETDWNHYVVRAMGDRVMLFLNGRVSVNYVEDDPEIPREGRLAVQLHSGDSMEIEFRDIRIQPLPRPTEDDADTPGFHLRTLDGDPARKYSVYLPLGYEGQRSYPVVLFLHGSGERGEDGILPTQVGLGPQLLRQPDRYPFIAVFPQARGSWLADSEDAHAALAALDQVVSRYTVDPERIILTGLSDGGAGAWDLASKYPDRFARVVPICGSPRLATAEELRRQRIWTFVGDEDRDTTLHGMRRLADQLRELEAEIRQTEYRGVGHNSWDRAYNDPDLISWMLAPTPHNP